MTSVRRPSHHTIEVELVGGNNPVHPTENALSTNTTEGMERSSITPSASSLKKLTNASSFNWRTVMIGSFMLGVLLLLVVALTIIFTRSYVNPHPQNGTSAGNGNGNGDVVKSRSVLDTENPSGDGNIQIALTQRTLASPPDPVAFHNIGEVGRGYNLLYGNPHSTDGADPGVKAPVFSMATMHPDGTLLPDARISDDGRFLLPAGVDVFQDVSCRLDWSTTMVSSASSYRSSLQSSVSASVSVNYLFYSASFSMSRDYKEVFAATQSGSSTFAKSSAECSLYTAYIRTSPAENHPNLSPSFDAHVRRLASFNSGGDEYDEAVDDFISIYGTHVPTRVVMGARYGQQSELSARSASSQVESDLKQTAKLSVMSSLNAEGMSEEQLTAASEFSKSCYSQRLFTMGSTPTQDMQGSTWSAQGVNDPAPIQQHELIPLDTLINSQWFPGADGIDAFRNRLRRRLEEYCTKETNGSPDCLLTGSFHQDRCVGGWIYVNPERTNVFNPVTGGNQCPTGYNFLTGFNDKTGEFIPFLPICISNITKQQYDVDCKLYTEFGNNTAITSFGGLYMVDGNGVCEYRSATVGLPIPPSRACTCPTGYKPYNANGLTYVCLLDGGHLSGRTFGGMFSPSQRISNDYIMSQDVLNNINFGAQIYDCPIGYKISPFLGPGDYICVLDANRLFSNIRPVKVVFPNDTSPSNITAKPVNRTMNVHKLHTLQHTIEAHIDAAADEPFHMIQSLDDDAAAETSPSPLDSLTDLGDSLDDDGETSASPLDSLDDDGDDAFHNVTIDPRCIAEFEDDQHAATARRCFRESRRTRFTNAADRPIFRDHRINFDKIWYSLDRWGRVLKYTCKSADGCTQKDGLGRKSGKTHSGGLIKFLRQCFGAINDGTDDDQAGHLLAVRFAVKGNSAAAVELERKLNNDPLNFIPLARSVNRAKNDMGLANWGNGENYAYSQLSAGCKVDITVTLKYPSIRSGRFRDTDYRPIYWTFDIKSARGSAPKGVCASETYQGTNG